ncbi:sepiapterin reductase [Uranotaenia lowii]|uniref:sepiapterin reductase n=1 Tax=Uranotaenia lowii TaxID=190385 RepID=UPI00247A6FF5|nr:sepiapterin reductase [Uranotaenia lowii]XP_055593278.1 sepiapterin reductase [Uranotaenia lowii]XP_055593279.1 sepiapterin reductase [Uranotaenia lowii]
MSTDSSSNAINFSQVAYLLVTGASRGIGQRMAIETSRKFKPGSIVVLLARSASGLEATRAEILDANPHITVVTSSVDLSNASKDLLEEIIEKSLAKTPLETFELAGIIHNVGTIGNVERKAIDMDDRQEWEDYFATNVVTVGVLNSCFLRKFKASPSKLVVNVTSKACIIPFKSMGFYCSGKAAREMYFKVLADEEPGLVVLNYSPGPVDTDMTIDIQGRSNAEEIRNYFRGLRETTTILTTQQTTAKFLSILEDGQFKSGDHVDYYD